MKEVPLLEIFGTSDIGNVRTNNEDLFASLSKWGMFLIADGMGGHNAGEIAAREAVGQLSKWALRFFCHPQTPIFPEQIISYLRFSIKNTNRYVYDLSMTKPCLKGMGTTICWLSFWEKTAIFAHIGDSRLYRYQEKKLTRLTQDHSLANKLFTTGNKQSLPSSYKGIITKALGTSHSIEPDINSCLVQKNDLFLLCTDGLSDFVADDQIETILRETPSLKKSARKLVYSAKEKGGRDNITVLLVRVLSHFKESEQTEIQKS